MDNLGSAGASKLGAGGPHIVDARDGMIVRRNFVLNICDGAVFAFGLSFACRSTVLPVYVRRIGGDAVALSLIPVLWILGFSIPQIAVANHARQVAPKKPLVLATALAQRLPWLFLAAASATLISFVGERVGLSVAVYYLAFVGSALTLGLRTISRLPIVAEICGEGDRPTYVALTNVVTAPFVLLGVAGGWLAGRVGYDVAFLTAALLALIAAPGWAPASRSRREGH